MLNVVSLEFGSECLQRRKKSLSVFVLDSKTKENDQTFCKVWASKLAESDNGSYFNQENWLKDDKASAKPIETTAKSSFTSFLASGASFLGREVAKRATNSRQVPRHIQIVRRTFLKVYCSWKAASGKTPGSGLLSIFPGKCRTFRKCIDQKLAWFKMKTARRK